MSDVVDVIVAFLVMAVVNLFIVRRIKQVLPGVEGVSLARIYAWTIVLRVVLACFLNAYAGQTAFAVMFWGDSATNGPLAERQLGSKAPGLSLGDWCYHPP